MSDKRKKMRALRLLTTKQAAERLQISPATLATWRVRKSDILPFVKIQRSVRYHEDDIMRLAENNIRRSTSDVSSSANSEPDEICTQDTADGCDASDD